MKMIASLIIMLGMAAVLAFLAIGVVMMLFVRTRPAD